MTKRKIVVGFSGGVTSAWCAGWALRNYPRDEVVLLWHDTKEEDPDTVRFLHEMAAALGMPVTEWSDGRSVTQVFRDEGFLGNNQNAMCSRILKREPGLVFIKEAIDCDYEIVNGWGTPPQKAGELKDQNGRRLAVGQVVQQPTALASPGYKPPNRTGRVIGLDGEFPVVHWTHVGSRAIKQKPIRVRPEDLRIVRGATRASRGGRS